jgi:hypothetical protein
MAMTASKVAMMREVSDEPCISLHRRNRR